MNQQEVLEILKNVGALKTGVHAVLSNGDHSGQYIQIEALNEHPEKRHVLCRVIAERFADKNVIDVVVGVPTGGTPLAEEIAEHLSQLFGETISSVCIKKTHEGFFTSQDFTGQNVLVIEDVLTTGRSVVRFVKFLYDIGTNIVGVGVIVNRGEMKAYNLGIPRLEALVSLPLQTWAEDNCPLCKQGIPINMEFGHPELLTNQP